MKVGVNGCVGWVMMCDVCCVVVLVFGWFDGGVVCWSGLCDEEVFVEFGEFEYFEDFVQLFVGVLVWQVFVLCDDQFVFY